MSLPGHRRTSSHKRRRASHFALVPTTLTTDKKTGAIHRSHRVAPGATEYNGKAVHVKGHERKLQKLVAKAKGHSHDHKHDHGHDHDKEKAKAEPKA